MYLHWDSHHNIPSKYSVIGTLYHRANTICSTTQYLQKEEKHLNQALKKCKNPLWAINRAKMKMQATAGHSTNRRTVNSNSAQSSTPKQNIVVPYHQGLSGSFKRTCMKYGIKVHCKGGHTIKNLLMAPKDKDHIFNKSGVIYRYKCHRLQQLVNCPTHRSGHCIDHIIIKNNSKLDISEPTTIWEISDHWMIKCVISITKPKITRKECRYRKIKDLYHKGGGQRS